MKTSIKRFSVLLALALGLAVAASAQRSPALQITDGPRVEGVGDTWAVIAWTTNTGGSSIIRYGTSGNSLTQTAMSPYADNEKREHQTHRVKVEHLQPGTTYYFMADSGQGEGTGTETKSGIQSFTTKGSQQAGSAQDQNVPAWKRNGTNTGHQAIQITDGPRVEGVGDSWAHVAWTTNWGGSSIIHYGTSPNALSQTAEAPYANDPNREHSVHRVSIKNLQPNTTYYFIVDSGQGEGSGTEAKSQVATFTTKAR
jgi:hypothetical protein